MDYPTQQNSADGRSIDTGEKRRVRILLPVGYTDDEMATPIYVARPEDIVNGSVRTDDGYFDVPRGDLGRGKGGSERF